MAGLVAGGIAPCYLIVNLVPDLSQPADVFGVILLLAVVLFLMVAPVAFLLVRLAFVPFLVVDEGFGPVAAIKESWRRVGGHGWTVLGVGLVGIPVVLLGLLVLFVGVIPASAWVALAFASLFDAVAARRRDLASQK